MQGGPPRVSIGLPVYNGENYLALAIDSLLAQTYHDFELIVSDNASTDRTEAICRDYASRDARIRYVREQENRGAAWNFNRLVDLARGEYFTWAAHDDLRAPNWLQRCVEMLDRDLSAVLCFTRHQPIDADGKPFNSPRSLPAARREFNSDSAHLRYRDVLLHCDWCYEMFGLVRTAVMRRTRLQRFYYGGDKMLLVELSLLGRFEEAPEVLFFPRQHAGQSSAIPSTEAQQAYVDPASRRRFSCPDMLRFNGGYLALALTTPLSLTERLRCLLALAGYLIRPSKLQHLLWKIGRAFGFGAEPPLHPALARAAQSSRAAPQRGLGNRLRATALTRGSVQVADKEVANEMQRRRRRLAQRAGLEIVIVDAEHVVAGRLLELPAGELEGPPNGMTLDQAIENLMRLGALLDIPREHTEQLQLRGRLRPPTVPLPPDDELVQMALDNRPDVQAFRLGIGRAQADARVAKKERIEDVFVVYSPFVFQNNGPIGKLNATSFSLGLMGSIPVFDRNQGEIRRSELNVLQTRTALDAIERETAAEVESALLEYQASQQAVERIERTILPASERARTLAYQNHEAGRSSTVEYLIALRDRNEVVRHYRDALIRRRRSMLQLNTAVGYRLLP